MTQNPAPMYPLQILAFSTRDGKFDGNDMLVRLLNAAIAVQRPS